MTRPPFPTVLDSSLITTFRSCRHKCYWEYFQHFKPLAKNVHLHAGGAFAHGAEATRRAFYEQGLPADESIAIGLMALAQFYGDFECPLDSAKSLPRMMGALEYMFSQYPLETDEARPYVPPSGKPAIEFSFVEPIDILHPETNEPILFAGRFDMIAEFAGGLWGLDDKTTSSLGASWSKQWDNRSQFTSYVWGAARAGIILQGFLVRGISILKTKYETQQALTYRPEWMVNRWYGQLLRDVGDMLMCWESGYWDWNLDHACNEFGGCMFKQPCISADPQPWLEGNYARRRWNPVTREEEEVE